MYRTVDTWAVQFFIAVCKPSRQVLVGFDWRPLQDSNYWSGSCTNQVVTCRDFFQASRGRGIHSSLGILLIHGS